MWVFDDGSSSEYRYRTLFLFGQCQLYSITLYGTVRLKKLVPVPYVRSYSYHYIGKIILLIGWWASTYIEIPLRATRQKYSMLVLVGMKLVTSLPAIDFLSLMFTGNTTN